MSKLVSRKLWVTVSAAAAVIYAAVTKQVEWAEAGPSLAAIVIGYCVAQGWIDGKEVEQRIDAVEAPEPPKEVEAE